MAQPSREEIIAYIRKKAAEKGIDPEVFLKTVEAESGFNPGAVGDNGQSFGLAQLYMGGGLGNVYEQQYGTRPDNPEDAFKHIDFMADQIVGGGKGLEPWHAWKGAPDAWKTGSTQQPQQPGRRGRASEVAQSSTPMKPPAGSPEGIASLFGMTPEEYKDTVDPRRDKTLGGAAVSGIASLFGNPGRSDLRASEKSQTLGQLVFGGPSDEQKKATEVAGWNDFAPESAQEQLTKLNKKKNLGSTIFTALGGTPTAPDAKPPTLWKTLFG